MVDEALPLRPLPSAPLRAVVLHGLVALLCVCGACGGSDEPDEPDEPEVAEASEEPEAPEEAVAPASSGGRRSGRGSSAAALEVTSEPNDSDEFGALRGTILFVGEAPERFQQGGASKAECKHHPDVDQRSNVLVVNDGRLAGAFVHLRSGYDKAGIPPAPSTPVALDQRGCMYLPRVAGLQLGQPLVILNSDPTTHNVNLLAKRNKSSNRSMGAGQPGMEFIFDRRELGIVVKCDIHPWMGASLYVEEHPWFAISGEDGAFRIPDVPPGEYVVEAMHELLGRVSGSVSVKSGETTVFLLTMLR